jgi:hypothetical protein
LLAKPGPNGCAASLDGTDHVLLPLALCTAAVAVATAD